MSHKSKQRSDSPVSMWLCGQIVAVRRDEQVGGHIIALDCDGVITELRAATVRVATSAQDNFGQLVYVNAATVQTGDGRKLKLALEIALTPPKPEVAPADIARFPGTVVSVRHDTVSDRFVITIASKAVLSEVRTNLASFDPEAAAAAAKAESFIGTPVIVTVENVTYGDGRAGKILLNLAEAK